MKVTGRSSGEIEMQRGARKFLIKMCVLFYRTETGSVPERERVRLCERGRERERGIERARVSHPIHPKMACPSAIHCVA